MDRELKEKVYTVPDAWRNIEVGLGWIDMFYYPYLNSS